MTTVFKQIGPYRIERQIGHGGMAVVFLATDTRNDRQVALKLVQQGTDREAREIVEAEQFGAELQQRFSEGGAHVPAVYEHGVDEDCGYFYVAMEYLDGENLSEVISHGPLPVERACDIALELARFLEEAHAFEAVVNGRNLQSLLHLDLKPRNVRITSAKQVKVIDFGTAKALSLSRKVTRNDFGSVAYLSPERLQTGQVDARADLWALGVVLYEMLRGAPPFQAEDTRRLERLILARRPPPPLPEDCAVGLRAVVSRLLDPVPSDRYSLARDIREDLERFKAGQRTVAEEQGWPTRASDDEATRRTRPIDSNSNSQLPTPSALGVGALELEVDHEATRRTRPPAGVSAPAAAPPPLPASGALPVSAAASPPTPAAGIRRFLPARPPRPLRTALLLIVLALTLNEISTATSAGRAANAAATREFEQLPDAWLEYERLAGRSYLHVATRGLERSLVQRTQALVDRVIANYRTPSPTVREAQWAAARDALVRALSVAGGDRTLRASLRYCEGHLHRINGEAKKARQEFDSARRDLTEAVVAFREAAELRRDWADPFLGLARTFVVGLEDVERGADALNQAQRNGYQPSDREFVQLADGYRARGNSLVRSARQVAGLPQEREYLNRAADAYRLALDLYSKTGSAGNVPQNVARAQRALLQIEESLGNGAPPLETSPASAADTELPTSPPLSQGTAPLGESGSSWQ